MKVNLGEIEIICRPCTKCDAAEKIIRKAIRQLEVLNKIPYFYRIKRTYNLREAVKYSTNIANTPFIIIGGTLALAGKIKEVKVVRAILLDMIKYKHLLSGNPSFTKPG